jgi:hypothetical protein
VPLPVTIHAIFSAIQSRLVTFRIAGDIFSDPKVKENQHADAKGNGENRQEHDRIRKIPHRHNSLCFFDFVAQKRLFHAAGSVLLPTQNWA